MEAIILALVALATAWSGFQAAQWNGYQAELYSESKDPFNNSEAALGPAYMPGYHSSRMEGAGNLSSEALSKFNQGTKARAIADDCVLNTVFLATVLVLAAISQRFQIKSIRTGLVIMSFLLLLFAMKNLSMLQRF